MDPGKLRAASWAGAAGLLAILPGCASAPPQPAAKAPAPIASRVELVLQEDMRPDSAIPWSREQSLAWTDFTGTPPEPATREAARTTTVLYYAWRCRGEDTESFEFSVIAGFVPRSSWVRRGIPTDTMNAARVLRHEQTHFDLAEAYARRMRRRFESVTHPCTLTDAELESLASDLVRQEADAQRRYDAETDHSLILARQAAWEQQVASDLASLNRYAGRVIRGASSP